MRFINQSTSIDNGSETQRPPDFDCYIHSLTLNSKILPYTVKVTGDSMTGNCPMTSKKGLNIHPSTNLLCSWYELIMAICNVLCIKDKHLNLCLC